HLRQLLAPALEDPPPDLGMRHLAPAEEDRCLDLVPIGQEALDVLLLELVIVLVDLRPELDFLDLDDLLVLFGRALPLLFMVLVAPEIHDAADRRRRRCRNLHEVQPLLPRNRQCLRRRHDAELFTRFIYVPGCPDPDAFVHPRATVTPRAAVECDNNLLLTWGSAPHPGSSLAGTLRPAPLLAGAPWAPRIASRYAESRSAGGRQPRIGFTLRRHFRQRRPDEIHDRPTALVAAGAASHRHGSFRGFAIAGYQHVRDLL